MKIHERGIFHRDIKLGNIIYNIDYNTTTLIDFGQADYIDRSILRSPRISTRPYKPPELLVESQVYDQTVDVWLIGQVLACLVI